MITGAADDDPSGISTFSVTGAAFGFAQLWTVFFAFPLMMAVQIMCARLGLVSGQGLAGVLRRRYPKWVLLFACALLAVANTVNIGADLGGMAEAMHWRGSLDDRPRVAKKFYGVLGVAVALGLAMNYLKFSAVKMLFYAAVVNGVLAPPLIVLVTMLTSDKKVMGKRVSPPLMKWLGWATALVMTAATIAMIVV